MKLMVMVREAAAALVVMVVWSASLRAQTTVLIDTSPGARRQVMDGFGTCLSGTEGLQTWWQDLFFRDLQCSILRMDLTPAFKPPYTGANGTYNSPWYHNNPPLPGPENNNVRVYTNALDYTRVYNGWRAPIAVMGPDINRNTNYFDFTAARFGGTLARLGVLASNQLGGFKLFGSIWSPPPWVKVSSGHVYPNNEGSPMPAQGTPWPFIWYNNFAGGKLDTSGTALAEFDDSAVGGIGPTSALTQFARCTAAYLRGLQQTYGVRFYAISIQNELNFEEFYGSCTYPLSSGYIAALKAVRSELDKYPDLAPILIAGPEDLLGGDVWGLWQYGGGANTTHKNLQYLQNIAADPQAAAAEAFFCIHGYAADGVSAANSSPTLWNWWRAGWTSSPAAGIPANVKGFSAYGKKSWMTETSGENPAWLYPADGFPGQGAWSLALRIHQALTAGEESAWIYWQLTDGNAVGAFTLTSSALRQNSAKFTAAKHYFRYIRPGAVRVSTAVSGSTNLVASAFLHDLNRTATVILLNAGPQPLATRVALASNPGPVGSWRVFSSSSGSWWQSSTVAITNLAASVNVPAYGVVTLYGVAAPTLNAQRTAPNQVTLSWSQAAVGFELEWASTPANLANWSRDTNTVAISNNLARVAISAPVSPRFYRLVLP